MVAISDLSQLQLNNAKRIVLAAMKFGELATIAALMAAGAESSFLRYANDGSTQRTDIPSSVKSAVRESLSYEYDRVAPKAQNKPYGTWDTTADSIGHYQQRLMMGYGTVAELMDPARSTEIFIKGNGRGTTRAFLSSPASMSLAQRVQWTQGSEYPTGENYAPWESVSRELAKRFWVQTSSTSNSGPLANTGGWWSQWFTAKG